MWPIYTKLAELIPVASGHLASPPLPPLTRSPNAPFSIRKKVKEPAVFPIALGGGR